MLSCNTTGKFFISGDIRKKKNEIGYTFYIRIQNKNSSKINMIALIVINALTIIH